MDTWNVLTVQTASTAISSHDMNSSFRRKNLMVSEVHNSSQSAAAAADPYISDRRPSHCIPVRCCWITETTTAVVPHYCCCYYCRCYKLFNAAATATIRLQLDGDGLRNNFVKQINYL